MLVLMNELAALHAHSVELTIEAVQSIAPHQLTKPTPCAAWNLAELLDHMTVQNQGFAGAAAGHGANPSLWKTGTQRDDPIAGYLTSATTVADALAEPGVMDKPFALPELSRDQAFTGKQAITMHTIDSLLHAWDVARSIGQNIEPDPALTEFAITVGEQIPDDAERDKPGAHFGSRVAVPAESTVLGHALALFGRSPDWSPA